MSDKENAKIDDLAAEVKMINLTLQGDQSHGIEGLIPMLQRLMKESNENFKTFKRDIALDWATDINRVDEKGNITDSRITGLEANEKKQSKILGYATGVGVFLGFIFSYLWDLIKSKL